MGRPTMWRAFFRWQSAESVVEPAANCKRSAGTSLCTRVRTGPGGDTRGRHKSMELDPMILLRILCFTSSHELGGMHSITEKDQGKE